MSDYTPTGAPPAQTRGISSSIRAEFDLIATAVNSKPDTDTPNTFTSAQTFSAGIVTVGGTYTGVNDFSGASSVLVPTPTLSAQAVTKAYADALSMTAGNVATGGTVGQYYRKSSSTNYDAAWATLPAAGMTLIATLTPTAAANVDFLTTFTSTYDNYLIVGDGITVAANDSLNMRFANAGTVDSSSFYYSQGAENGSGTSVSAAASNFPLSGTITSAGQGANFAITVLNANDSTRLKMVTSFAMSQDAATPSYIGRGRNGVYSPANAISGFRLYLNGGSNFGATGKVYVYGYSKT